MTDKKTSTKKQEDSAVDSKMEEAAKEQLKAREEKKADGVFKRQRGVRDSDRWVDESIPLPEEFNIENLSPTSYLTKAHGEITGLTDTQEFTIDQEKLKGLTFNKPAMNLPKKRQYTVKALHKDGRLVQVPFEMQINNTAGGSMEDAIGLRRMARKGMMLFIDWNTLMPVYCAAWNCWAAAMREDLVERFPEHQNAIGTGFCSMRHAEHTMPNRFKDAAAITSGLFGQNATTSRVWSVD